MVIGRAWSWLADYYWVSLMHWKKRKQYAEVIQQPFQGMVRMPQVFNDNVIRLSSPSTEAGWPENQRRTWMREQEKAWFTFQVSALSWRNIPRREWILSKLDEREDIVTDKENFLMRHSLLWCRILHTGMYTWTSTNTQPELLLGAWKKSMAYT